MRNIKLLLVGLSVPLNICMASIASADVLLLNDYRSYEIDGSGGSTLYTPSSAFADWELGYQGNNQASSISEAAFSASGSGSAYSDYSWSESQSIFDFTFELTSHYELTVNGLVWGQEDQYGVGNASSSLYQGEQIVSNSLLYNQAVSTGYGYEEAIVNYTGILDPGVYRFRTIANPWTMVASSGFEVTGTLTPVPIPAAGWLFGAALAGLTAVGRRR